MRRDDLAQRVQALEAQVAELAAQLAVARRELRVLDVRTAPADGPPARLALESVTRPVVKVVAFSAGARRAVGHLTGRARADRRTPSGAMSGASAGRVSRTAASEPTR